MASVTTFDILDLNRKLKAENLPFKIHLSDACGSPSMWIESFNNEAINNILIEHIETFFKLKRIKIKFNQSKTQFWCI